MNDDFDFDIVDKDSISPEQVAEIIDEMGRIDLKPCTHYLSTGCTILDLAIAGRLPGGFGGGRISHIYGGESTAKTILVCEILGSAQRQGGMAYFGDAEHTFDWQRACLFGLDTEKNFEYHVPTCIENMFDDIIGKKILKKRKEVSLPAAIGEDSITALPSIVEIDGDMTKPGYGGSRAKAFGLGFRKYVKELSQKNTALILVDQERQDINVQFGDKGTFSGGKAVRFYASTRVQLKHVGQVKNSKKIVIGVELAFRVKKNKIAPPFRSGKFRVLFDYGIDDISTSLLWLKEWDKEQYKKLDEENKGYVFGDTHIVALTGMVKFIEEGHLEKELRNRVQLVWNDVHKASERCEKIRWDG